MTKALIVKGTEIRAREEMLCLTDLWRAAGSPENKAPYQWSRYEGSDFIDFVRKNLNRGDAPIYLADKGKGGATWACEQLFMAYAKYLSHEFHAHVNDVYLAWRRGELEPLAPADVQEIAPEVRQVIGGIVKSVLGKHLAPLAHIADRLAAVEGKVEAIGVVKNDEAIIRGHYSSKQVIRLVGITGETGSNSGLSTWVRNQLHQHAAKMGIPVQLRPDSDGEHDKCVFHKDVVHDWLDRSAGRIQIKRRAAAYMAKKTGQAELNLVTNDKRARAK